MTNGSDEVFGHYTEVGPFVVGLTKREMFAALAMQGMFTNELLCGPEENTHIAKDAVSAADALIAALNANEPQ